MTILIVSDSEYVASSRDMPKVGARYILDDASGGTTAQNNAFHALLTEYWVSGLHSYNVKTFEDFRNTIKLKLGAGYESYDYADVVGEKVTIFRRVKLDEIPEHVWVNRHFAVRGNLKSWRKYNKHERTDTIDRLIAEMEQVGCNSKKYQEIRNGMEE